MQVTFAGNTFTCDSALRGGDYVQLLTADMPTVSFFGVSDFDEFELSGGEWSYPYVTLPATGWTGTDAPYTQTVEAAGVTSTNDVIVSPKINNETDLENFSNAQIQATAQGMGTITFSAFGYKPTTDLQYNVKVLI